MFIGLTQGSRKLEPWADISQRLRRISKLDHYSTFNSLVFTGLE